MTEDKKASVEKSNISTSSENELLLENNENSKNLLGPVRQDRSKSQVSQAETWGTEPGGKHEEKYCFDEYRVPIEIKSPGKYILSETKIGESFILFEPNFFEDEEASELMDILLYTTDWQKKNVTIRGIEYRQPRLVAWYGPFPYSYSGATLEPAEMPDYILKIKKKVEQYLKRNGIDVKFNSVLLNLYRHNKDSVSWHSDDEMSMGVLPTIASVSLGDTRRFEMRRKLKYFEDSIEKSSYTAEDEYFVELHSGSLLIMDGCMQQDWQHRVPKEYAVKYERVNLTFRIVYEEASLLPSPITEVKHLPLEKASKLPLKRKDTDDEKSLNSDTNAASSAIVCKSQDLTSPLKSGENCFKSPFKVQINNENDGVTETSSHKITITIKNELNEPDKQQEPEVSLSSDLSNFNDNVWNIRDIVNDSYKEIDGATKTNSSRITVKTEQDECSYTKASGNISNFIDREIDNRNIDNDSYQEIDGVTETVPHKITLKTEDEVNKPDEEQDLQLSYSKRSTSLNFSDDQKLNFDYISKYPKNIPNSGAAARKNKRFRTNSQNTSKDCFQNDDFAVKESSADNKCALNTCPGSTHCFGSLELKNLLNHDVNLMNCKLFFDYTDVLKNSILLSIDEFNEPEKSELKLLCQLTDGTQTEENQKLITKRMYCIVEKALKVQLDRQNILKSVKSSK